MDLNRKTVLVFGGAGFIGSNFIRLILSKYPKVKAVNFDKLTYSGNLENVKDVSKDKRYSFSKGDIADQKHVRSVFSEYKPDFVINFAAETHVDRSVHGEALEFVRTNVEGVFNILESVKESKKILKYVEVSTDEVFGSLPLGSKQKFEETTVFAPNTPYAATKAGGDLLCRSYFSTWKIPVVVTHCSNNYGPNQYPEKLIPFCITRMMENKKLPIYGDGKNVRDWIYVMDHCRALELCLIRGIPGETYGIGADTELDNLTIARMILSYFKRNDSHLEFVADRPGHDRRYAIDSSKIRRELGWVPEYDFEKAFRETIGWYLSNEKWLRAIRKKTSGFNTHITQKIKRNKKIK
ncbi:MAG: dTDP-glucose 4,6-dehydratase [Candidatus Paceibacterota bacterium]|jgi:dTDP-glucose 4,6-dehydratase|nr:dTDP-glucose 4,6-dehydratase [Candidatus Paceibacterota bacterium]